MAADVNQTAVRGPGRGRGRRSTPRPPQPDPHRGGAGQVEDQVPAGVGVAADVGLGQCQGGDELDDLVDAADPHAGQDREDGRGGVEPLAGQPPAQHLGAGEGGCAEAEGVDQPVEAEQVESEHRVVEDSVVVEGNDASGHVGETPDGEGPQHRTAEVEPVVEAHDEHQSDGDENQVGDRRCRPEDQPGDREPDQIGEHEPGQRRPVPGGRGQPGQPAGCRPPDRRRSGSAHGQQWIAFDHLRGGQTRRTRPRGAGSVDRTADTDSPAQPPDPNLRARLSRSPHVQPVGEPMADDDARADELLRLASLTYGADSSSRRDQARQLLAAQPELARRSIHTMAAVGDVDAATERLRSDPSAANRQGGPFDWEPLLYAAYSRLDDGDSLDGLDSLEVARLLLAHGADPNAGFLWDGLVPPFTVLTGVLGRGEGGQPPHPRSLEFARLLLDAGADPNDAQAIYNRGPGDVVTDDTEFLELLIEYGFGRGDGGPWYRTLAPDHPTPAELIGEAMQHAAEAGLPNRTRLLLANGADPNGRGLHPGFGGRTAYEGAVLFGNVDVAGLLLAAGADEDAVDHFTRFVGACMAGDRTSVESMMQADASLLSQAIARRPDLIARAAERGRPDAVRLMAGLGFDVNARRRATALHEAAWRGDVAIARVLIDLGADPTITDREHHSTPRGWAEFGGHGEVAVYLAGLES